MRRYHSKSRKHSGNYLAPCSCWGEGGERWSRGDPPTPFNGTEWIQSFRCSRNQIQTWVKQHKAVLVCCCRCTWADKIWIRKFSMKADQMSRHCTAVYTHLRKNFFGFGEVIEGVYIFCWQEKMKVKAKSWSPSFNLLGQAACSVTSGMPCWPLLHSHFSWKQRMKMSVFDAGVVTHVWAKDFSNWC